MKVLILGAGAVGLSLAARLSSVCEVHALCRERQAEAIRRDGFQLSGIWGAENYRLQVFTGMPAADVYDYCIITSKSHSTRALCEAYREILARSVAVSLQNGIGNEEIIREYCPQVIGGTIITGFEWRGDGAVQVTVEAGPIRLGPFPGGRSDAAERLVELIRRSGLKVEGSEDIRANIWAKTLYNCALNPLGAILDVPYGELAHRDSWAIIQSVIGEAYTVSRREGLKLPWEQADDYLAYLQTVQLPATAGHHSSMLQDIRSGRRTEIDFMNGAIVRLAATHDLSVPVNETLVRQIRFVSRRATDSSGAAAPT